MEDNNRIVKVEIARDSVVRANSDHLSLIYIYITDSITLNIAKARASTSSTLL